jgi:hypothetical protein
MGSLILILPVFGFSVWLLATTGLRAFKRARQKRNWTKVAIACVAGIALAWWFTFHFEYKMGPKMRIFGFPVPGAFFYLEENGWVDFPVRQPIMTAAIVTDALFGIALAFFPFKVAEFFGNVKAEL